MTPSEREGVLCAGSLMVDFGKVIDAYPQLDHLTTIESVSLSTGGPGLNMAVDLKRLGVPFPVSLSGLIGDDENGAFLRSECSKAGIVTDGVRPRPGVATSFTDAMVERDGGRRTFFHHPGANALFDGRDVDFGPARILHAGAPGLHRLMDAPSDDGNGWSALLCRAQKAGLRTNLELVSVEEHRIAEVALPCLPHTNSLVINEFEAGAVTGLTAEAPEADGSVDWTSLELMATRLVELGVRTLAVVHFPAGCVAAAPDGRVWRQGSVRVPREQVVSTTGAGDAFAAGVVMGLHEGWPVEECLRLGAAAAAACVRSAHTSEGIADAGACLRDADSDGYRPVG
jgi:sugar/nucleoside kinase (ribokinase family)